MKKPEIIHAGRGQEYIPAARRGVQADFMKRITRVEKVEKRNFSALLPHGYKPLLDVKTTERAILDIKITFSQTLQKKLGLQRVSAPLFLDAASGLQDNLNGVERPVEFTPQHMPGTVVQVPHSLAKWKRWALAKYGYDGIWTDMNAIRRDERPDSTHSMYVDQYDWEKAMRKEERTPEFLQGIVRSIYAAIRATERMVAAQFGVEPALPKDIRFVHTEDMEREYPKMTPRERENAVARECRAVFIRGIGAKLPLSGEYHDGRAPDYDDWSTRASDGRVGLNGDIFVWYPLLDIGLELSSMGIRVDAESLVRQLEERNVPERLGLPFHRMLRDGELPLSCGGGIGQSRLAMFLLKKAFVGEVHSSTWPAEMVEMLGKHGIVPL